MPNKKHGQHSLTVLPYFTKTAQIKGFNKDGNIKMESDFHQNIYLLSDPVSIGDEPIGNTKKCSTTYGLQPTKRFVVNFPRVTSNYNFDLRLGPPYNGPPSPANNSSLFFLCVTLQRLKQSMK